MSRRSSWLVIASAGSVALRTLFACDSGSSPGAAGGDDGSVTQADGAPDASDAAETPDAGDAANTSDAADATSDAGDAAKTSDAGDATEASDAAVAACSTEGWCRLETLPGLDPFAVWGDGLGTVWIAGGCGSSPPFYEECVHRWDGTAWHVGFDGADAGSSYFSVLFGTGPTDLWVGGASGLFHGQGGSPATLAWTQVSLPLPDGSNGTQVGVASIWASGPNNLWVTGESNGTPEIWHFSGPAAGWTIDPLSATLAGIDPRNILVFGSGPDDVWLAYSNPVLGLITVMHHGASADGGVDGGAEWVDESFNNALTWTGMDGPEPPLAVTAAAVIGGAAWFGTSGVDGIQSPVAYPVQEVLGGDGGISLVAAYLDLDSYFDVRALENGLWGTSPNDVWLVSGIGHLHHFDGTSWRTAFISSDPGAPYTNDLRGIWGQGSSNPNEIWVVGHKLVLHMVAGGGG